MGIYSRTDEILDYVRDLKSNWGNDPFKIADKINTRVVIHKEGDVGAYVVFCPPYPQIISISGNITDVSRRVLCAHELGHAILHEGRNTINRFAGTSAAAQDISEYEANLFAVALLFDENDFNRPLSEMTNGVLKLILDYNIKVLD